MGRPSRTCGRTPRRALAAAAGLVLLLTACTSGDGEAGPTPAPTPTPSPTPERPVTLTYGVWGSEEQLAAHEEVVAEYNEESDGVRVELRSYPHRRAAARARAEGEVSDVFLAARRDMAAILDQGLNQPVDRLLDERGVEFGDGHQRMGLVAFSGQDGLQCMPYGTSPMVVYYNTELLDLERMERRGLDAPAPGDAWGLEQFAQAAEYAARPRRQVRGLAVDPSLATFAPLLHSGGGSLLDDEEEPTSLSFSSEESRGALERALPVLRDPQTTPEPDELEEYGGSVEMFQAGKAAMVLGFRDLVPELRDTPGLSFDVMPVPTLDGRSTIGEMTGVCLSSEPEELTAATDFLVHVVSVESVSRIARTGALVPANLEVSASPDFLQPQQQPATSDIYNSWVRYIDLLPLLDNYHELDRTVRPLLSDLLHEPVLPDLEGITTEIDETSQPLLGEDAEDDDGDDDGDDGEDDDGDDEELTDP